MNATARWQELISENLAASSAPGARRQDVTFSAVAAGLPSGQIGMNPNNRFGMPTANAYINFSQGQMQPTGVNTDFAIEGPAFFQVELPGGNAAYTRNGSFQISPSGQLVTQQGYPVVTDNGNPIQMDPTNSAPIMVSPNGDVSQDGQVRGKIKLAEFSDPSKLQMISGGYFETTDPAVQPSTAANKSSQVRQGFIEESNVSPTVEMATMITAMRMFESNQKVLQMQDDRMGKVISDLGGQGS